MAKLTGTTSIWPDELGGVGGYNRAALGAYPDFLTRAERVRLEKIRQARMLFDGRHEQFYLSDCRTQFSFRKVRVHNGNVRYLYLPCNVLKLVSMKSADLLMGEVPLITCDSPRQQDALNDLADRSQLHQVLYQAALDASVEGEAFLEAIIHDDQVFIQQLDGDEVFPVGGIMPDGQHAAYIRRQLQNVGTDDKPINLLLEATYRPGSIERHVWQLDDNGRKGAELALAAWPAYRTGGTVPPTIQQTGVAVNTLVWVPNLLVRGRPVSDYDGGVVGLQDGLNAKNSQLAVVLLKHAQPKLLLPEAQGAAGETARPTDEVFFARPGDEKPEYLTWDAQLEAAQKDRAFCLNQILIQTETSPVLLGMKEGAAPDAYRKVRLEAFNSLTKAARRCVYWTRALRRILTAASMLELTLPGKRFDLGDISVTLRDGIPKDSIDHANELAIQRSAGLLSVKRGVSELIDDPAGAEAEVEELKKEAAAATPSVLFSETDAREGDVLREGAMAQA